MCLRARRSGQRGTHDYVSEHLTPNRRVTVQLLPYFDTLLLFDFQEKCRSRETFGLAIDLYFLPDLTSGSRENRISQSLEKWARPSQIGST